MTTPPPPRCSFYYRMEFPIVGGGQIGSGFGAIREGGERWHAGVDIEAPKMTPVVAVRDGRIEAVNNRSGDCCWVKLRHDDGWQSYYIHLNNDTYGTDDGNGIGIRPDLAEGMRIRQGELIGWVGDSGNAETAVSHLHFELRTPWGEAVDPGPSLWTARRRLPSAFADAADLDRRPLFLGAFADDDDHPLAGAIDAAATLGLRLDCDPWGLRFCPSSPATRQVAIGWIEALEGGPPQPAVPELRAVPPAVQLSGPITPELLRRLMQVRECADPALCGPGLTRGEVAVLVLGAIDPTWTVAPDAAVARLHAEGRIDACAATGSPSAEESMTRAALLHMLLRAFGYLPTPPCGLIS